MDPTFPYWYFPPSHLSLSAAEVHIWMAHLDRSGYNAHPALEASLSSDEVERARRYLSAANSQHFMVGRGILRGILGRYLGIPARQVQFGYGPRGKPSLAEGFTESGLEFNLAHSHGLALYAFSFDRQIGIDLEYTGKELDLDVIVPNFFAPGEIARLSALPESQKRDAFYQYWTSKEAYIKASGDGLARPLDRFEVSFGPDNQAGLLNVQGDPGEAARWSLRSWQPAPNYMAAVAVEGRDWNASYWLYN